MKKGFTLLETAVALTIFSLLIYLAATTFLNLLPKYKLEKSAWDVGSALQAARAKAIFKGHPYRVRFGPRTASIERFDEVANVWILEERRLIEGADIEANNAPVYIPDGTVTGLATIIVANAWGKFKITLAMTGRIKKVRLS
jgi:prepilin-type N-terminal cleavage/methylation domain-containing protein